ncbi:hypothetical protein DV738_g5528, partial [Chaetothyriales sp. CBS 135597]
MEASERVKCTYDGCNFYFATEKEMIRHKKKDPDHFYCQKCDEDYDDDTEYMIHQILSPRHTVCPSCGMEFKSASGRDRHSHAASQRLPCRGCGMNFTRAASLMQHIEKDQCRVIRRRDFECERAERSVMKDAFVQALGVPPERRSTMLSSIRSPSSAGSGSAHGGGVSLLHGSTVGIERGSPVVAGDALMNSPQSQVLTEFPPLQAKQTSYPSASSQRAPSQHASSQHPRDLLESFSTLSVKQDSVWTQSQGHGHLFPAQENVSPPTGLVQGTGSKYDELSEVSFPTTGSQGFGRKQSDFASQVESVPPAPPRFPERNAHITTRPPPRISRLDLDQFWDPVLRSFRCPGIKCQGMFATAERFRSHLQGPAHAASHVICPSCLRHFKTTTALMSHMESGSKRCNARNTTNYNQLLREVSAGLIGTSGQLEDGTVKYSVPNDEGWEVTPDPHAVELATNPRWTGVAGLLLLVGFEAAFCAVIIAKVAYTEIDWATYMTQVGVFLGGERHYEKLTGPTGPCVYPAMHVYIYSALYEVTEQGRDILRGQMLFALLYLATLAVVFACYRRVNAPPWLLLPLVLSKRLHSIFLLRMFNDCWAAFFLWSAIYLLQRRKWAAGALVWGVGLGVKMTLLLAAPGLAFVLVHGAGFNNALVAGVGVLVFQVLIGAPFMQTDAWMYLRQAFDFGRVFLFKWTVNYRFLGEEIFLSKGFAVALLVVHLSLLLVFAQAKWVKLSSANVLQFGQKCIILGFSESERRLASQRVTPTVVMDAVLGSMAVGLLCARSLHYQFYAYLGWATPYLLWRADPGWVWMWMWTLVNCAVQEIAWLTFPSTSLSSGLVVAELALQVWSILIAPQVEDSHRRPERKR